MRLRMVTGPAVKWESHNLNLNPVQCPGLSPDGSVSSGGAEGGQEWQGGDARRQNWWGAPYEDLTRNSPKEAAVAGLAWRWQLGPILMRTGTFWMLFSHLARCHGYRRRCVCACWDVPQTCYPGLPQRCQQWVGKPTRYPREKGRKRLVFTSLFILLWKTWSLHTSRVYGAGNPSYPSPSFNPHQFSANLVPSKRLSLLPHLRYWEAKSRQQSRLSHIFQYMTPKTGLGFIPSWYLVKLTVMP